MDIENISKKHKTWLEIDIKNIEHNYEVFRSLLDAKTKLMAVVKSNAYGHDMIKFSKEMVRLGADFLGVDDAREAFILRSEKIQTPILIFSYIEEGNLEDVIKNNISVTVSNFEMLFRVVSFKNLNPKIHIKVDTGLGRQGFTEKDMEKLSKIIQDENMEIEGLYTHYSVAESPSKIDYTKKQTEEFQKWIDFLNKKNIYPKITHSSAASGAILDKGFHFGMVRIGIGLFGHWGSRELKDWVNERVKIFQVATWKTIVAEIKEKPKGSFIGYNLRNCLKRDSKIAILPIGYWHGLTGIASEKAEFLINGKRVPILGRVAMDMSIIDVSDLENVKVGDEVVIVGEQMGETITTDDLKYRFDLLNYEFLTRINADIPRIYK